MRVQVQVQSQRLVEQRPRDLLGAPLYQPYVLQLGGLVLLAAGGLCFAVYPLCPLCQLLLAGKVLRHVGQRLLSRYPLLWLALGQHFVAHLLLVEAQVPLSESGQELCPVG